MARFFKRKNKNYQNDEALEFLTMPKEEVKTKKKLKFKTPAEVPEIPLSEQEKMEEIEDKYLQLQPKTKRGKRKKILQIAFLIAICVFSIVLLSSIGDGGSGTVKFSEVMKDVKAGWFVAAFFSFFVLVAIDTFRFAYITKLTTNRFRPMTNFKVSVIGKYYDNITPLATGGQPFQMYYLAKKDIPAGVASSIPLIKFFVTMFTLVIVSLLLIVFNSRVLLNLSPEVATTIHVAAYLGVALSAILPFLILSISIFPKFGKKIVSGLLKVLSKIRIGKFRLIKDFQKTYYKTLKNVGEYRKSLKYISTKKFHLGMLFLISIGEYIFLATIPYFLCVALGGANVVPSFSTWFTIVTLYTFVINAVSFLPTPGNSGFAEGSFFLVFAGLAMLNGGTIFWIVLFWRIITYYLFILLGMIVIFYDFISNTIKEKIIQRNKLLNTKEMVLPGLNSWDANQRMSTITVLKNIEKEDKWFTPKPREGDIKLFLKTNYSSVPYSPSSLAYKCYENGSKMIGICDSETLSGAKEFYNACSVLGMGCSIGVEVKTDLIKPKLNRRINNLYQTDIVNLAVMGIPVDKIDYFNNFLHKYRQARSDRNYKIVDLINKHYKKIGVTIDYKKDVLPISNESEGGTVTEMHILLALCNQLINRFGKGQSLVDVLRVQMEVSIPEKSRKYLISADEKSYVYDLLYVLKNDIRQFYVDADKECCSIVDLRKIAGECQAIIAYEYMGDIEHMVFGETRVEVYEDAILEYLLKELKRLGITAVTVSPSRHTAEQIERIRTLSKELDLLVIINETIYTRRQEIKYPEITKEQYPQLIENAWSLCGNEKAIKTELGGFFSPAAVLKYPDIQVRAAIFSDLAKAQN